MINLIDKPVDTHIEITNNSKGGDVKLIPDIQYRVEYQDELKLASGCLVFTIKSEDEKFLFSIKSAAKFSFENEEKEYIHQECFNVMYAHIQEVVKNITTMAGFVVPLELPDIKIGKPTVQKKISIKAF